MGGLGGDTAIYGVDAAAEGIGFSFFHNGNLPDILTDILYNLVILYANRHAFVPACLYINIISISLSLRSSTQSHTNIGTCNQIHRQTANPIVS